MTARLLILAFITITLFSCNTKPEDEVKVKKNEYFDYPEPEMPAVYKWYHDACNYEGTYLFGKYTPEQLEGTYYIWHRTGYLTNASPQIPRTLYEFNLRTELAKLEEEYKEKKAYLEQLELVPGAEWENLRQARLRELKEIYGFVRVSLEGIADPYSFFDNPFSEYCREYSEALNADDAEILEAWRVLIEKRAKSYGYESIEKSYNLRYRENRNSPDSVAYAKIDIFHYGWYECADKHVFHVNEKGLKEDFEKLFSDIKKDCPPEPETDGI